ncbi:hypothetical protein [Deinococcus sp. Leaf326]|uniref:hypothetical protein n=1 Tax=Deinococcus sp. Leaf326 TaxID=1736338 RepID=UPI0006FA6673|nr:hypothetical protein [Deinococcus sp. Leaf326]KQR27261.1 hypothetical protein ASF71_17720 [Deinococcus sp. Leaf326]
MAGLKGGGTPTHRTYLGRIANRAKLPIDLERITNVLNKALDRAEEMLDDEDKAYRLKAIHSITQAASSLMRVLEVGEQEARLAAVEEALLAQEETS